VRTIKGERGNVVVRDIIFRGEENCFGFGSFQAVLACPSGRGKSEGSEEKKALSCGL
jgi:hypothetical protein